MVRRGSRDPADTAFGADLVLAIETTTHPALIPRKVAGTSRQYRLKAATRRSESPAVAGNPRLSPLSPEAPRPACHAGGRGFESLRSRSTTPRKTWGFSSRGSLVAHT
jgi:hypothetical protein